jgi:hypothetical protein
MRTIGRWALLPLVPTLVMTGCVTLHGPEEIRRDLSKQTGVKLDHEFSITVNRGGMWLARQGLKWSGEDEISLKGINLVDVGIYEPNGLRRGFEAPRSIHPDYFDGYEALVRVQEQEDGENVLVMTREKNEKIKGLIVVVTEPEEWVIVRVKGNLNQILEQALAEAFDEIERPDLYEKTREERGLDEQPGANEDSEMAEIEAETPGEGAAASEPVRHEGSE